MFINRHLENIKQTVIFYFAVFNLELTIGLISLKHLFNRY